jgi:hypothetical protein
MYSSCRRLHLGKSAHEPPVGGLGLKVLDAGEQIEHGGFQDADAF